MTLAVLIDEWMNRSRWCWRAPSPTTFLFLLPTNSTMPIIYGHLRFVISPLPNLPSYLHLYDWPSITLFDSKPWINKLSGSLTDLVQNYLQKQSKLMWSGYTLLLLLLNRETNRVTFRIIVEKIGIIINLSWTCSKQSDVFLFIHTRACAYA